MVTMEWEKLRPVLQEISPASLPSYKNLRGTIDVGRPGDLRGDEAGHHPLPRSRTCTPTRAIWEKWPKGRTFVFASDGRELCQHLPRLLCLCPLQKKSRRLGFLTLYTDWKGNYWFKSEKSLLTARTETPGQPGKPRG